MLIYLILISMWMGIIFGWLIPVIRKHIIYEIYEAIGLGGFFTLLVLGLSREFKQFYILPLRVIDFILYVSATFFVILAFISLISLKYKGKPEKGWEHHCSYKLRYI